MSDSEHSSSTADFCFDWQRESRTGVAEAVLCEGKTARQVVAIVEAAVERRSALLLTRIEAATAQSLRQQQFSNLEIDDESRTAILNIDRPAPVESPCLIVTAGTSDMPVAGECQQTLRFYGLHVDVLADCGVAGLWRLTDNLERLRRAPVIVAIAGMEGALFPVLGGLVSGLVIAVPGSNGYGVATGGKAALSSALASCSPGVVTVNIDNGFGAACALLKVVRSVEASVV